MRVSHRAVDDLTATLNARDLEARDKDARLVDQDKDLQASRNHLARVEGDCAHWRAKNDDAAALHAQEARLLDEDRARNADLQGAVDSAQIALNDRNAELDALTKEIDRLRIDLGASKDREAQLERDIDAAQTHMSVLDQDNLRLTGVIDGYAIHATHMSPSRRV